ncbi:hypothetical protein LTR09_010683 [Extremus antarcticus]|uniref:Haloalkane dehalogenase n=1 Tax=Extremus antarcticus TaxID=702011 RepID=A0AAJ0D733_9PEZI|nr:hypothetical protein LTR09_010683 [Extremus antarcticus]
MADMEIPFELNIPMYEVDVLDSRMAYISTGTAKQLEETIVFLHGNPTSSYLWRNIIPHVSDKARCIAPDLIGMGRSLKPTAIQYRFVDHEKYLSSFLQTVVPNGKIILVLHDWGSALGLDWARRHEHRVSGLVLMEFVYPILRWEDFPETARATFQAFRDPVIGRQLLIEQNTFIEEFLPSCVVRPLSAAIMDHYRAPFKDPSSREPLWRWPNEYPVEGSPPDVSIVISAAHEWLLRTNMPKLMFWATPGGLISESKAAWYASTLKNTHSVGIGPGIHYLQEDNPDLIGKEIAVWLGTLANRSESFTVCV